MREKNPRGRQAVQVREKNILEGERLSKLERKLSKSEKGCASEREKYLRVREAVQVREKNI